MSDDRIRIVTIAGALAVLLLIIEFVRRRKLKEEYSVLWVVTALVILVLAVWYGALDALTDAIGASQPSSTLFFFGLSFALVLLLHFSIRISALERRNTALIQEIALMRLESAEQRALPPAPDPGLVPQQAERQRDAPSSSSSSS